MLPEISDTLTTHWLIENHAECPCCGKPMDRVIGLELGASRYRMSYGHAAQFASAILDGIERETAKR